jgi:hypothetical protein
MAWLPYPIARPDYVHVDRLLVDFNGCDVEDICRARYLVIVFLSKTHAKTFTVLTALLGASTSPLADKIEIINHLLGRDVFEWTAMGDSYSSGVGAGEYVPGTYRCLRYGQPHPFLINADSRLPQGDHQFNNVVCSGSSTADAEAYQFYDKDTSRKPNVQYGMYYLNLNFA